MWEALLTMFGPAALDAGVSPYVGGGALTSQDMLSAGGGMPGGSGADIPGYSLEGGLPSGKPNAGAGADPQWATMGMSGKDMSGYADMNNNLAGLKAMGVPFDPYQRERQPIEMKGALNNYMGGLLF